jgi:hypothetical protein
MTSGSNVHPALPRHNITPDNKKSTLHDVSHITERARRYEEARLLTNGALARLVSLTPIWFPSEAAINGPTYRQQRTTDGPPEDGFGQIHYSISLC